MSSTPKEILFEETAREKLAKGIKTLADAVAFTLGPKGRNVGLEKSWGTPDITNDGNSVVREIELEDQYENMGVAMAKEVAQKMREKCGDGTTTGMLLLQGIVEPGVRLIASGASPISVKRGIEKAVNQVIKNLEESATAVNDKEATKSIATVSASGDVEIGAMIAEALEKVGDSQVVTIEEGQGTETSIEIVEGMQFDRGYISPYFCTNSEKLTTELENPQILLVEKKIGNIHELLTLLQHAASVGKPLLIIAEDIEGDALSTLVVNKLRGTVQVAAVKAPGFGDKRKAMLEDIAALTGATVVSEDAGSQLKDAAPTVLGSAGTVSITKDHTTIVNGAGAKEQIQARLSLINNELENTDSAYEQEKLNERKAKLSGGVAVIRVGASTEPEMKERKQNFEDSLNSTKAALEEGTVTGGGVALLQASANLSSLSLTGDEAAGASLVAKACQSLLRQIAINAGLDGSVVLSDVAKAGNNHGFNALTGKVENLYENGVIDALKVVRNALQHAASVAGIVLISEALIGDAPEDEATEEA